MHINNEAILKILGIKEKVALEPEEMASNLTIAFFPREKKEISEEIKNFGVKLKKALIKIGVAVIPYEDALIKIPFKKLLKLYLLIFLSVFVSVFRKIKGASNTIDRLNFNVASKIKRTKRIRPGVSIIALGENEAGNLPMDYIFDFAKSSVITILDMPSDINSDTEFHKHFDTMMRLFSRHMTNIAIIVSKENWILYNFNASHPTYLINENFERDVLRSLVPKIAAPIRPPKLSEFVISPKKFDPNDDFHKPYIADIVESGPIFEKINLYPRGKKLDELSFRNNFYRWVGGLHLDNRNGMSYGFLSRQLPTELPRLIPIEEAKKIFGEKINDPKGYFYEDEKIFIILNIKKEIFCMETPAVWVLTQRSGSNKTKMNPQKDAIKLGLANGRMIMEIPVGLKLNPDYKPSFDTKVILAHALSNAIIGSVLKYFEPHSRFADLIEKNGMGMAHWHGYINPDMTPEGWHVYGFENAPVPCSSPQSAIYAFNGKINAFMKSLADNKKYRGDIHVEPQHGVNISFSSLKELGDFLANNPDASRLGDYYLNLYKK